MPQPPPAGQCGQRPPANFFTSGDRIAKSLQQWMQLPQVRSVTGCIYRGRANMIRLSPPDGLFMKLPPVATMPTYWRPSLPRNVMGLAWAE